MDAWRANNKVAFQLWPVIWVFEDKAAKGLAVRSKADYQNWLKQKEYGANHGWFKHETAWPASMWGSEGQTWCQWGQ